MKIKLHQVEFDVFGENCYSLTEAIRMQRALTELLKEGGEIEIPDDSPSSGGILTTEYWDISALNNEWDNETKRWERAEPKYYASYRFPITVRDDEK